MQEEEPDCKQHHHDIGEPPDLRWKYLNTHRALGMCA
jgi:hypothetical protein